MHKLRALRTYSSAIVAIAACSYPAASHAADTVLSAWSEFTGTGVSVRVVVDGAACPTAVGDGKPIVLHRRAEMTADFPAVCEGIVPAAVHSITVGTTSLPGPAAASVGPRRIVLLGDTGCRLKDKEVQDCNDPAAWPFAQIAAHAAAQHPDLVIHVGDYYYRETPCPAGRAGCAGSPYGDRWPSWRAEFFGPGGPLLAAAPWVFVRGNHETCGRGASGWFRFLDTAPQVAHCPTDSAPFTVRLGQLGPVLHVMDSADTEDDTAPPDKVALFAAQFDQLGKALDDAPDGWILTHRPIWGFKPKANPKKGGDEPPVNVTEQTAAAGRTLAAVSMVISGHVHFFSTDVFGPTDRPARPAQLVVGNGGDTPSVDEFDARAKHMTVAGLPADTFTVQHYGYLVLDRVGTTNAWHGTLHGADDRVMGVCEFAWRQITCRAP